MVRIISGLEAGEQVLLAPPLSASSIANGPVRAVSRPSEQETAAEATQVGDSAKPEQATGETEFKLDPSKFSQMSPDQIKKQLEKLTPEQRAQLEKMRAGMQGRQGRGGSRREPAQ